MAQHGNTQKIRVVRIVNPVIIGNDLRRCTGRGNPWARFDLPNAHEFRDPETGTRKQISRVIRPWKNIREYYAESVNSAESLRALHQLVVQIESSRYRDGLFAWTSACDLCIVQTPVTYPYDGPYLRISPIADGQLEFRYLDTPFKNKQWHRTVNGSEGFARLERFMEHLHWFGPPDEVQ